MLAVTALPLGTRETMQIEDYVRDLTRRALRSGSLDIRGTENGRVPDPVAEDMPEPEHPQVDEQRQGDLHLLNQRGCRLMSVNGRRVIGCWPELDDRDFQEALKLLKMDHLPVLWLDGPTIPEKYRTCRRQVQRLRVARRPVSWEKWVLSRPVVQREKISVGANEEGIHASL